ncbi:N-acetyltransferase [Brevibacillus reuszeri]|uniref:Acetyltransferase n=1 Tax=Brevibacillus reuszeri TaxID=54915 RepID=A0A0K9YL01_9BACL|nr:GNAT family N-acetyltransferase [Brevibacillus reuszeri]KNB69336.1 acetyltransferase [Brevibacillus reuszeri]MED1860362.1 GNAT family N-acetyltransferase [Brevibacillus reuszeri]GED70750.1 N-acetyltransferase [Brevibacillus reuszeri]
MNEKRIQTNRLLLLPFTKTMATSILQGDDEELVKMGLSFGDGFPDEDTLETIPKIVAALDLVDEPTGFESWMIIRKDTLSIIGDAGFKGRPNEAGEVDIGYGIVASARKKGYGIEAAQGLVDWAFSQPEVNKITARCLLANIDSAKVLEKMDFKEVGRDDEMIYWALVK